jgi:hypothetical protein
VQGVSSSRASRRAMPNLGVQATAYSFRSASASSRA